MQAFVGALILCSISMSLVTLVYRALLPALSRRYAARWRYTVWLVIAVGWAVPLRPQTGLSLWPAAALPDGLAAALAPAMVAVQPAAAGAATGSGWVWLAVLWAAGAAGAAGRHAWRHRQLMRQVGRWSSPVTGGESLELLDDLRAQLGIRARVGLAGCPGLTSPMLIGFVRPTILLPAAEIPPAALRLIMKHELVHLRRHDLWFKALVLGATVLHWFNPVVYLMARETAVQCEMACDARVLRGADLPARRQYGEMIVAVARKGARLQTALSTNYYGGEKGMKARIISIMDTTKKRAGTVLVAVALAAILGTGSVFAAGAMAPASGDAAAPPEEREVAGFQHQHGHHWLHTFCTRDGTSAEAPQGDSAVRENKAPAAERVPGCPGPGWGHGRHHK